MKEYEKHIKDELNSNLLKSNISFCGNYIDEWAFINVDHYVATRQNKGRLLCCPKCRKVIIDLLKSKE